MPIPDLPNLDSRLRGNDGLYRSALAVFLAAWLPLAAAGQAMTEQETASIGAREIKKIPREFVNAPKAKRFSLAAKHDDDAAAARHIEEIRVLGSRDPEDITAPNRAPMLAFREMLENDKPLTPLQKTKIALCFIGLCGGNYGPDGAPVESQAVSRAESRTNQSSLQMSTRFGGTYQ